MFLTVEQIAQVCHAANTGLQQVVPNPANAVSPAWDQLPQAMQDSGIAGVMGVLSGNTPEQQHAQWSADKIAQGWMFGAVKDLDLKTHPCLIPYADLPETERIKDRVFIAVVKALSE